MFRLKMPDYVITNAAGTTNVGTMWSKIPSGFTLTSSKVRVPKR